MALSKQTKKDVIRLYRKIEECESQIIDQANQIKSLDQHNKRLNESVQKDLRQMSELLEVGLESNSEMNIQIDGELIRISDVGTKVILRKIDFENINEI